MPRVIWWVLSTSSRSCTRQSTQMICLSFGFCRRFSIGCQHKKLAQTKKIDWITENLLKTYAYAWFMFLAEPLAWICMRALLFFLGMFSAPTSPSNEWKLFVLCSAMSCLWTRTISKCLASILIPTGVSGITKSSHTIKATSRQPMHKTEMVEWKWIYDIQITFFSVFYPRCPCP